MAAPSSIPSRKSFGSGAMTSGGGMSSILDGPPPNPVDQSTQPLQPGQTPPQPSFSEMAAPLTAGSPGRATTPEVLMGVMNSLESMSTMYDSMASIIPDLASDFAMLKDIQQRVAAKLLVKGGQPASPVSTGLNFPGGGYESGSR